MKLSYRGINYDYNPATPEVNNTDVNSTDVNLVCNYRGSTYRVRKLQNTIAQQPGLDLKYRGVAYNTAPKTVKVAAPAPVAVPIAVPVAAIASVTTDNQARNVMMNRHRSVKQRQQSMLSRMAKEVGLSTEFAAHYWNPIQGKINPQLLEAYDRSQAALS